MTVVCYADVGPLMNKNVFDMYFNLLPDFRKEKVNSLKNNDAKILSAGAWFVLEKCAEKFGVDSRDAGFSYQKSGKPYFSNNPELNISISHSGNTVVCAVSDRKIGVDVECIDDFNDRVCRRFFGRKECDLIFSTQNPKEKNNWFFRIWTLRESYVKLTGKGIGDFSKFEIDFSRGVPEVLTENGFASAYFYEYDIPGYRTAVCLSREDSIHFERINIFKRNLD